MFSTFKIVICLIVIKTFPFYLVTSGAEFGTVGELTVTGPCSSLFLLLLQGSCFYLFSFNYIGSVFSLEKFGNQT